MEQVKVFYNAKDEQDLEDEINNWLKKNDVDVIERQLRVAGTNYSCHIVVVIYYKEK